MCGHWGRRMVAAMEAGARGPWELSQAALFPGKLPAFKEAGAGRVTGPGWSCLTPDASKRPSLLRMELPMGLAKISQSLEAANPLSFPLSFLDTRPTSWSEGCALLLLLLPFTFQQFPPVAPTSHYALMSASQRTCFEVR